MSSGCQHYAGNRFFYSNRSSGGLKALIHKIDKAMCGLMTDWGLCFLPDIPVSGACLNLHFPDTAAMPAKKQTAALPI